MFFKTQWEVDRSKQKGWRLFPSPPLDPSWTQLSTTSIFINIWLLNNLVNSGTGSLGTEWWWQRAEEEEEGREGRGRGEKESQPPWDVPICQALGLGHFLTSPHKAALCCSGQPKAKALGTCPWSHLWVAEHSPVKMHRLQGTKGVKGQKRDPERADGGCLRLAGARSVACETL